MQHRLIKTSLSAFLLVILAAGTIFLGKHALGSFWAGSGVLALRSGLTSEALRSSGKAVGVSPSNSVYQYINGLALLGMAEHARDPQVLREFLTQATQALQRSIALNPLEAHTWSELARATFWLSQLNRDDLLAGRAQEYLDEALALDPNNPFFLVQKVQYCLMQGRLKRAMEFMPRLARSNPEAYFKISYPGWRKYGEPVFKKELDKMRQDPLLAQPALEVLSFIAASNWDWVEAAARTKEEIGIVEEHQRPSLYQRLGYYMQKAGDQEGARKAFLQGLKLASAGKRKRMTNQLLVMLREERALDLFQRVLQQAAGFDTDLFKSLPLMMGKSLYYQGSLEKARLELEKALKEGENPEVRLYLARIAAEQELWDEAELEAQRGAMLDRVNPELYYVWAQALLAQSKHRSALNTIESALRYAGDPKPGANRQIVKYLDLQAKIYQDLRNLPRSIESWQQAAEIAPMDPRYPSEIGNAYAELGELKQAERWYSKALGLAPGNKILSEQLQIIRNMQGIKTP